MTDVRSCPWILLLLAACATNSTRDVDAAELPEQKQTSLGLYVTARGAHEMRAADPQQVHLIDVRTPEEYVYVGHPPAAPNVPYAFMTNEWDSDKNRMKMRPNPGFVDQVRAHASPTDTLLLMCRSGDRSAPAVELLRKAGFEQVYTVVDGFEGDSKNDRRTVDGWKNSGLPWTYELDPELVHRAQ